MNQTHELETVEKAIKNLDLSGVLEKLDGNCITAADIFQNLLDAKGLRSKIIECSLLITNSKGNGLALVGYNFCVAPNSDQVDTHAVVLVECNNPFIIDASISHILKKPKTVVVLPLDTKNPEVITEGEVEGFNLMYRVKKNIRLGTLHQKTLLQRVNEDIKLRSDVSFLSVMVKVLIVVGLFNAVANSFLLILKWIFP